MITLTNRFTNKKCEVISKDENGLTVKFKSGDIIKLSNEVVLECWISSDVNSQGLKSWSSISNERWNEFRNKQN